MRRSVALGHCVCDPKQPCPCPTFRTEEICECAGERLPPKSGPVRLTEMVRGTGCSAKIGKTDLLAALSGLPDIDDARVVVGRSAGDDAGVIMLSDREATVMTVDVLAPPVDDPFTFGQIAAANSLSDIYAMGATPQCALSIIGFPAHAQPIAIMREILRGGFEKMKEAGISVLGGHSTDDDEIKFGFAVLGTAKPGGFLTNAGARVGDVAVLTKPLGTGIVSFAAQCGQDQDGGIAEITRSMTQLNQLSGARMQAHGAHAATDITGFGLLPHVFEVARSSQVEIEIDFDSIPLFSSVMDLAARDVLPGAVERNRESLAEDRLDLAALGPAEQAILFGPETSGGLVVFLPEAGAGPFLAELRRGGFAHAAVIGRATSRCVEGRIRVTKADARTVVPPTKPSLRLAAKGSPCCCKAGGDDST